MLAPLHHLHDRDPAGDLVEAGECDQDIQPPARAPDRPDRQQGDDGDEGRAAIKPAVADQVGRGCALAQHVVARDIEDAVLQARGAEDFLQAIVGQDAGEVAQGLGRGAAFLHRIPRCASTQPADHHREQDGARGGELGEVGDHHGENIGVAPCGRE